MKEIIVACAIFVAMSLLFESASNSSFRAAATAEKLKLEMTVNKNLVPMGQQISFTLILTNIGNKDVTISFGTSQAFDLSYYTTTGWQRWSDGKYFFPLIWEVTLQPGQDFSQTLQWDLYQYNRTTGKFLQPDYGTYDVAGTCVGVPGAHTVSPTTIKLVIPGDVNGDGAVRVADLYALGRAYGHQPKDSGWNANCDINADGTIDDHDLVELSKSYGNTNP